jgi:hypothetical protein
LTGAIRAVDGAPGRAIACGQKTARADQVMASLVRGVLNGAGKGHEWRLEIAGEGPTQEQLPQLGERLGLARRID